MSEQSTPPAGTTRPQTERGSSPLWILSAVALGFMLPVAACVILTFAGFLSLGIFGATFESFDDSGSGPGVGVVDVSGVILNGSGIGAASENLVSTIEWMDENDDVKAIVVTANSPGGDANASDVIWQALSEVEKPVVVSVNGLCASGCYYVAMAADHNEIYATPNSLIGSIGVISTFFNVEELADDIGVDVQIIATGESKDFGSPFRDLTPEEVVYWREQINVTLDIFISRVVGGRPNLSEGEVRQLATGRVWAASIAQENGLIDGLMYPDEVFDHAADLGGLDPDDDYRRIESPYEPTLLDIFLNDSPGFSNPLELPDAQDLTNMLQQGPIQYRYLGPYSGAADEE